jgi:condensin complex subunit 3
VLCQAFGKLYLPPETGDDDKVRTLLMQNLCMCRPLREASAQATLTKFDNMLLKRFEKQLEDFNEAKYCQLESLRELFEFLDDIVPLDEDEDEEDELLSTTKKHAARKHRSESVTTDTTSADNGLQTPCISKLCMPEKTLVEAVEAIVVVEHL